MRRALAFLVLLGCGAPRATGPAWPKSAGTLEPDPDVPDGGHSIDAPVGAFLALEKSAEPERAPGAGDPAEPATDEPAPGEPEDTKLDPISIPAEEPLVEEIVIEIEIDD